MSDLLHSKLDIVRRKRSVVSIATGVAAAVALVVGVTFVTAMLDWWFNLSYTTRAILFALQMAAAVTLLLKLSIWPIVRGPDEETLALSVEQHWPVFRSRLISAIQLGRPEALPVGAAPGLVTQLVRETEQIAGAVDFGQVVTTRQMTRVAALCVALVAAGGAATAYGQQTAVDLIKRAVLVPGVEVPRKTRVRVSEGDRFIARGDSITLTATADGLVPKQGTLITTNAKGVRQSYSMAPDPNVPDGFSITIGAVPESFTYTVQLNDGVSPSYRVETVERPAVASIAVRQIYPQYTGLSDVPQAPGDMSFLAGSRMVLDVTATKKLMLRPAEGGQRSVVRMIGTDVTYPLELDINDPAKAHASHDGPRSIPLPPGTRAMRIELVDETGVTSKNETEYRIDVVPDRPPTLAVTSPAEREVLVTPKGLINVGFDGTDDFAIAQLELKYRPLPATEEPEFPINGLTGQYFDKRDFAGRSQTRIDPAIEFDFEQKSPMAGIPVDNFSVRWRGQIKPLESGTYTFTLDTDDGVRLWVDGKKIIDEWHDGDFDAVSQPIELSADKAVDITLEYFENAGNAHVTLMWARKDEQPQVVPTEVLFNLDAPKITAANAAARAAKAIPLEIGHSPKSTRGFYPWKIESLGASAPIGTTFEWWIEARDNNDQTGPGVATSEKYLMRVVTEAEKRAELMGRVGDYFGEINAVREGQVDLSTKLGTMVQEKPAATP